MQWIIDNWVWILFGTAMIGMHMFGHGGHGGRTQIEGSDQNSRHAGHGCCGGGHTKKSGCCGGKHKKDSDLEPDSDSSDTGNKAGSNA